MKITDVSGIKIGDKVAITISNDKARSASISGELAGIQTYAGDKVALLVLGLGQWIYLESNMTVTWAN
jgi:multidrug resistance efflux pump